MGITQTGNLLFGNWWDVRIERIHGKGIIFTKENYEKELEKAKELIKKYGRNVNFTYPKIKWFNEQIIQDVEDKVNMI